MTCSHNRGGYITEMSYWLCADCLTKMESRPRKYGMVTSAGRPDDPVANEGVGGGGDLRQSIVWMAEHAKADDTLFSDFLRTMTRRIMQRTRPPMARADAYNAAIDMLKAMLPDAFGDQAYVWNHDAARDLVDMEMDNWDGAESVEGN